MSFWIQEKMKKITSAVTILLLAFSIVPTWASNEAFNFAGKAPEGKFFFSISEEVGQTVSTLAIQPSAVTGSDQRGRWINCYSTRDPECDPTSGAGFRPGESGITGNAVLDYCRTNTQENCIESLMVSSNSSEFKAATFIRNLKSNMVIPEDKALGHPGGSTATIWSVTDPKQSADTRFLVSVNYGLGYFQDLKKYQVNDIMFSIVPFREVTGDFKGPRIDPLAPKFERASWGSDGRYFLNEDGAAGVKLDFEAGTVFKLKVRTTNAIAGWFRGRVKDPSINVESFSPTNNVITIQGEPVTVPTMGYLADSSNLTKEENTWSQNNGRSNEVSPQGSNRPDVFSFIQYFRPKVADKAMGINTYWSLQSTRSFSGNKCLEDTSKVIGVVTTNSMGFAGGSPTFADGILDYKVAGMHFLPDGVSEASGTYDLLMRSEVARCLYGFSKAPISASVSITGGSDQKIATTVVNEKDGWLKLAAYGFAFSEKTLRVRILQEASAPTGITFPKPMAKKTTITCVKGKTTKKVTAVGPKCPSGFKKKS
jgi:hypothetical protein